MPEPFNVENPQSKNSFFKNIKRFVSELGSFKFIILFALVMAAASSILSIIAPDHLSELTDTILAGFFTGIDFNKIREILIFLTVIYILSALLDFLTSFIMAGVSNTFVKKLRTRISKKINLLPLRYFDEHQTGDILSRVVNDVDMMGQSTHQAFSVLVSALTLFIGTLIMMFVTNWQMALTALIASLIGFGFVGKILSKSQKYFTARQKELGRMNAHIEEIYSGINVVKAYNGEVESNKKFNRLNERVRVANLKSQFLTGIMMPLMGFIGNFGYVAVCVVGAVLAREGVISFGTIVAFMVYIRMFTSPLNQIAQALSSLQATAAATERVFEFLDAAEMPDEKDLSAEVNSEKVTGKVDFSHVKFGYKKDKEIIHDFSISVKPGQKVAIVGPTGAGKTTLVNLLMKFYDVDGGAIMIDDVPISEIRRKDVHSLFTMVLQDTWMFEGSLKENIVYNRKNVSDEKVMEVLDKVGLKHFADSLPDGIDSDISENDSVSAGQKQLITIARGLIEDAPLLILDEATSNVDTRTEEKVQRAMDELMKGRTSFVIAHRLSTIKNADLILVLKDGDIVESGNHKTLLKAGGAYAELYNSQFSQ
jgi:ATP-binding cassette subfamily B protein